MSTAYANCGLLEIEEKVYKLALSATDTINKVNCIESLGVNGPIIQELMEGRPNAYTFSKAVAENLVNEKYSKLPVVIVRPSIVTPSLQEPAPGFYSYHVINQKLNELLNYFFLKGWVDNLNGVAGTLLLGSLGIARTMEGLIDF